MNSLVWFRNDLRVADNTSLYKASSHEKTLGVYCFDPRHFSVSPFGFRKTERYRAQFLRESVEELRQGLKERNITLLVYFDQPETVIPELVKTHNIQHIYLQAEWTSEEAQVLKNVKKKLATTVRLVESCDHFLFHPEDIPFASFDQVPDVFTFFRKKCEKYALVRDTLPEIGKKPVENLVDIATQIPTLEQLGIHPFTKHQKSAFPFKGGEQQALCRLGDYFWNTKHIAKYKKTRNGLIGTEYSSKFSAWLANGCITPRTIYAALKEFETQEIKNQDTYWLFFELLWRDFFKYVSIKHKDNIFKLGGILERDYDWKTSKEITELWINGKTQEPFVNANMIELRETGFMSNRGRQNVASYWSKELQQDWRIGAAYFESMLIDYDVHSNWCNWMYLSGVGNDPRDRKFNIEKQAENYDPQGTYQKLWLNHL